MKKSIYFIALLFLTSLQGVQAGNSNESAKENFIKVLNPAVTTRLADRVPLVPRLDTLNGKTIYLVDDNWRGVGGNDVLHEEMEAWFHKNMPDVKIVRKIKKGNFMADDPALWKEIAENGGDGVILGVAG